MKRILTLKEEIGKFFFERHLDFLTSVPQQRIQEIMLSSCTRGNSGKLTDFAVSPRAAGQHDFLYPLLRDACQKIQMFFKKELAYFFFQC